MERDKGKVGHTHIQNRAPSRAVEIREKEESDMVSKAPWYTGCANKGNEASSKVSDLETDDKVCQLKESRNNSCVYC